MEKLIKSIDQSDFKYLINTMESAIIIANQDSELSLIYANDRFYEILQYSKEEFSEKFSNQIMAMMLPEDKQKIRALMARQAAAGGKMQLEFRVMRKDGTKAWISFSARSLMQDGLATYYCSCLDITQSKRDLAEMYQSKRDVELIANNIPGGVIKLRMTDFKLLYANDGFYRLSGYSKEEYLMNFGNHVNQVVHPADSDMVANRVKTAIDNHGLLGFEYRIVSKTGQVRWSYINGCRIDDDEGKPVYLCIIIDITEKKRLEERMEMIAQRVELLSDMMKETTWTYDIKNQKLYHTGKLLALKEDHKEYEGPLWIQELASLIHPDEQSVFYRDHDRLIHTVGNWRVQYRIKTKDCGFCRIEMGAVSISTNGDDVPDIAHGFTRIIEDSSVYACQAEGAESENTSDLAKKINEMAQSAMAQVQDNVTDLMPYHQFLETAQNMLNERTKEERYTVFCADIHEFRKCQYLYGFSISNEILKDYANVLKILTGEKGIVSRVAGDYFVGLTLHKHHQELLQAISEMNHFHEEMERKDSSTIHFDTTLGLYLVDEQDSKLDDMLENADLARRSIKGIKGNPYAIYTDDLEEQCFREEEIVDEIYSAMKDQTAEIVYLPRMQGNKENIIGCKAIVRVQLSDGKYAVSDYLHRFIERGGKLDEFSFYGLYHICSNVGAWKAAGRTVLPVSVEMTARQLSAQNAVTMIEDIVVRQNKLEPKDIIFEIPERYLASPTIILRSAIRELGEKGYSVVISRFGGDHTAVHMIRKLPIAGIKFHGEYFGGHTTNQREKTILKNLVSMAKELGMSVSCGGIHTNLQEEFAREIGCDVFEGDMYYGAMRNDVFEKCFLSK